MDEQTIVDDKFGFDAAANSIPSSKKAKPKKRKAKKTKKVITPTADIGHRVLVGNPKRKQQPCPECNSAPCVRKSRAKGRAFYKCRNPKCEHRFEVREGAIVGDEG